MTNQSIGIIGLGYVGLPLAVAFAKKFSVIGYDIDANRIQELKLGIDRTYELTKEAITAASKLVPRPCIHNLLYNKNIFNPLLPLYLHT